MRNLLLLFIFASLNTFAADWPVDPVIGDGVVKDHTGKDVRLFKEIKTTELQMRRHHLRQIMVERICRLTFWIGKSVGTDRCLTAIAKEDVGQNPDLSKIVAEIRGIQQEDELQDPKILI